MQNRESLNGFVLHKRPYRETSLLVDLFTLEYGRVSAVAKGARGNSKSDRKSLLQSFQYLEFELSGRSNLKSLGRLESKQPSVNLSGNALYCAFYINEILSRALPESASCPDLFAFYQETLSRLKELEGAALADFEIVLREFELSLLHELGYLPDFEHDASTLEPIDESSHYTFNPNSGFESSLGHGKHTILGKYLLAIAKGDYDLAIDSNESNPPDTKALRKAAKYICRLALTEIIGSKPIKSRELFI